MTRNTTLLALAALSCLAVGTTASPAVPIPPGVADATIDLTTREGVSLAGGVWRYSDAQVTGLEFPTVGADRKPTGPLGRTWDIVPHAGAAGFDDSGWPVIDPASLADRRSGGKLSFSWYRINVTIPEKIGAFDTTGSTVVFEIVVDDYAEVWVDGELPRVLGLSDGHLITGWNRPNRVLLGSDVTPGRSYQIAVFGINGPISDTPPNYIWVRSARLRFHKPPRAVPPRAVPFETVRLDPAIDAIVPRDAVVEKLAEGFSFIEGPVWVSDGPSGHLLFSGPNSNVIYRWDPDGSLRVVRDASGYEGDDIDAYGQPGSNGLTLDREGRLTICEHGNHRISRIEKDGSLTVLADRYEGRRLNSPNDLVQRSDGALYFTDPPFGLPKFHDDPRKELPYSGVFRLQEGRLQLLASELTGPNGLAFSPDERYLYVDNWDTGRKVVMRYPVMPDGTLAEGSVFFDMTGAPGEEALDGLKVDVAGNLYVSGPGGVWIISPRGVHLGTIAAPELPANFAWGDADGRTLYMTARTGLYRIRLGQPGIRPGAPPVQREAGTAKKS